MYDFDSSQHSCIRELKLYFPDLESMRFLFLTSSKLIIVQMGINLHMICDMKLILVDFGLFDRIKFQRRTKQHELNAQHIEAFLAEQSSLFFFIKKSCVFWASWLVIQSTKRGEREKGGRVAVCSSCN